jgi:hypothetical protein
MEEHRLADVGVADEEDGVAGWGQGAELVVVARCGAEIIGRR